MKSSNSVYLPRLDHLRFLAAMLVFTWHTIHDAEAVPFAAVPSFFPLSLFEEGHTGVSFFLTLSGFILAALCTDRTVLYGAFIRMEHSSAIDSCVLPRCYASGRSPTSIYPAWRRSVCSRCCSACW